MTITHVNFFTKYNFFIWLTLVRKMTKDMREVIIFITIKVDSLDEFKGYFSNHMHFEIAFFTLYVISETIPIGTF